MVISFDPAIPSPSEGNLRINFTGKINDSTAGFNRSKYLTATGDERYDGVTQFEPTFARKCFPCFDEPGFKAKFDLSLILPKQLTALSNKVLKIF